MLSKCANPSCSTPFIYLREGKIFAMEHPPGPQPVRDTDQPLQTLSPRLEHFWLCGPCSAEMTLVYDRRQGVLVLPKTTPKAAKAAS